jgi:hypothetical protein
MVRPDMNKRVAILLAVLAASRLAAAGVAEQYAPLGRLILTNFASAPFPHPDRAQGHSYQNQFFSAADHYQDSHVAIFIPKDFRAGPEIDFVVHFHGWRNNVTNVLARYQLPEQFAASHRNAILIVPQGPLDAPDSFGGKLEDAEGFKQFMTEAMEVLRQQEVVGNGKIGRIILSGHSGGYEVISAILAHRGVSARIREVWLFDALYGKTERFALWFDHHAQGRFIDLYTEHGGTKEETMALMPALNANGVPYFSANETNAQASDLRKNHLLFLFSELPHDEVMQKRETFRQFLETSCLSPTGTKSVRSVDFRDAPEAQELAERARQMGDDLYPQVRDLLDDRKSEVPRQFDIVLREHLDNASGIACRETVVLNAGSLSDHPEDLEHVMIHEMAHVAQNYPWFAYRHAWRWCAHYLAFKAANPFRPYPPAAPLYWTEGIADYAFAQLSGQANTTNCPRCDQNFPDYKDGYACAASFLLYMNAVHGSNFTSRLNVALRTGTYSDRFFIENAGQPLDALWEDFQKTSAYTPVAGDYNELDQALGFTNGKPPKDLQIRLEKYFAKHPDIKECLTSLDTWRETPPKQAGEAIKYFLWVRRQADGEKTLATMKADLNELHQSLGYVGGNPPGDLHRRLVAYCEAHPDLKEFAAKRDWLEGQPSPKVQAWMEAVILGRILPGGNSTEEAMEFLYKLKQQDKLPDWSQSQHGTLIFRTQGRPGETYPVYRSFECRKNGHKGSQIYVVAKASPDSEWELKRAWAANAKGRFLREIHLTP